MAEMTGALTLTYRYEELGADIDAIRKALQDDIKFMRAAANLMIEQTLNHFEQKVGPGGQPWPAVSSFYGKVKKFARRDPGNLLKWSGRLSRSISRNSVAKHYAEIGVPPSVKYAGLMQEGGAIDVTPASRAAMWARVAEIYGKNFKAFSKLAEEASANKRSRYLVKKRPFMYFSDKDADELSEMAFRYYFEYAGFSDLILR